MLVSAQFSHRCVRPFATHGLQHTRPPCPLLTPRVYSNSCPLSWWCHPTILSLCRPLLLPPSIFLSIRVFSNESALRIRWPKYWSFSFNISPSNEHPGLISFSTGLVGSPCSPRDSQASSPTPQLESLDSLALSLLYGPALTSLHDNWKIHSFDYTNLCWQSGISGF